MRWKKILVSVAAAWTWCFAAVAAPPTDGHAVIVHFRYGSTNLDALSKAESQLAAAIEAAGVGQLDGYDVAVDGSNGRFYLYGPDADRLLRAVEPVLARFEFAKGATILRRYGPPEKGVRTVETKLP